MLVHFRSQRLLGFVVLCAITIILLVSFHDQAVATARHVLPLSQDAVPAESGFDDSAFYNDESLDLFERQSRFWRRLHGDLIKFVPKTDALVHPEDSHLDIGWKEGQHKDRPDLLVMTKKQHKALREAHSGFVRNIKSHDYPLPFVNSTRGIVTTAGGPYLIVALVSIRMLRQTGSTLAVEVFLADHDEWDEQICDHVFPELNAKCVVLSDVFDTDKSGNAVGIDKYQYKIMAILLSSFEEVLFLDADCFPIYDPESLFANKPFTDTGLILWPDFWYPSESPLFFEIANIAAPDISRRPSTESGEMLYSKTKHGLSLLLAAYYNYHGPNFYYPLQSQGAPGEGDKETFLWSAIALNEPLRSVRKQVKALGYKTQSGDWRGSAMVQFDPVEDMIPDTTQSHRASKGVYPRPFFLHVNFPKLDPARIFDKESFGATGPTKDSDGSMRRIWHENSEAAENFFGFDIEREMWLVVKDVACRYESSFAAWRGRKGICERAQDYWRSVFEGL